MHIFPFSAKLDVGNYAFGPRAKNSAKNSITFKRVELKSIKSKQKLTNLPVSAKEIPFRENWKGIFLFSFERFWKGRGAEKCAISEGRSGREIAARMRGKKRAQMGER